MAKAKKKNKRKAKVATIATIGPTPEQESRNPTKSLGMARRFTPVIDQLREDHKITPEQHAKLDYYRQQASLADRSPTRDSCDFSIRGGSGRGPSMAILSAMSETYRMEAQMGPHRTMMRKLVVEDLSPRQWCLERFGGYESGGRMRPKNEKVNIAETLRFLRVQADRMEVR